MTNGEWVMCSLCYEESQYYCRDIDDFTCPACGGGVFEMPVTLSLIGIYGMGYNPLMPLSPWLIVVTYLLILLGLMHIDRLKHSPYLRGMQLIALAIMVTYLWIGIFIPPVELSRVIVRYLFFFDGGAALYLIALYIINHKTAK